MENTLKRTILSLALSVLTAGCLSSDAHAQAKYTATRILDLQVGGLFVSDFPDYTRHKFYGYGFWGDLDFTNHLGFEFEFRQANDTTLGQYQGVGQPNSTVIQHQRTFDGGLRYFRHYGKRLQPYAKVVFGSASEEFPALPSASPAERLCGNLLLSLPRSRHRPGCCGHGAYQRRFDFEAQQWFAAINSPSPNNIGDLPRGLTPFIYSGGVSWRFGNRDPRP
jgi:hypothetical protein